MKRLVLSAWCLVLGASVADACTGFYVGKRVSADGTTLIGRTVDAAPWNGPMRVARFERGEWTHADGSANACAFICASKVTSQGKGFYGGGAINEKGVMLSATVTGRTNDAATEADPFVSVADGGFGEPNLPDLMIGHAATAREAVEILGATIAAHGHSGPEIYMVADSNEAWYVEVYTGHQWAARRMPEDQVAVFGNQFNIREFNTNDTENVMFSPNLVKLAVDRGFAVWTEESEGIVNLYETYSPPLGDYANYRTYWGHHAWAPTAYPDDTYTTGTPYPLFFAPDSGVKPSLTDVFELMRTRYEGVNCPEEKEDASIRVIGTTKQMSCHVLQLRPDLPEDYRCTLWECLAQAEHSTFLPLCMAVKSLPDAYARDQEPPLDYDGRRAADAFLRLDTLAEAKRFVVDTYGNRRDVRPFYGAGVRAHWRAQEDRLVENWPQMLAEWMAAGVAEGRAQATAYVNFRQVWTLAEAKRLHDELAWYWAEFNCDMRDGGGSTDVPTYPFASSVPTNAELGVSWTRWHRTEFAASVEELAGPEEARTANVKLLVAKSRQVFDGVESQPTLAEAESEMAEIIRQICLAGLGPAGSRTNPWGAGDSVVAFTNGEGRLAFEGAGSGYDFATAAEAPWSAVKDEILRVTVGEDVTKVGVNALAGLGALTRVNGLSLSAASSLDAAISGLENPVGAISGAQFDRIEIVDGTARLGVEVYTNTTLTAEGWGVATNGVIEVPASAPSGYFILRSGAGDVEADTKEMKGKQQ